jgi:hypothetical protein
MRRRSAPFEGPEIGRAPAEAIVHVGQDRSAVDRRGARLDTEIEVFGFVDGLDALAILRIQSGNVHEDVVVDQDAVLVLASRLTVFRERRELTRLKPGAVVAGAGPDSDGNSWNRLG